MVCRSDVNKFLEINKNEKILSYTDLRKNINPINHCFICNEKIEIIMSLLKTYKNFSTLCFKCYHGKIESKIFKCGICENYISKSERNYLLHLKKCKVFDCKTCGSSFKNKRLYTIHKNDHVKQKKIDDKIKFFNKTQEEMKMTNLITKLNILNLGDN